MDGARTAVDGSGYGAYTLIKPGGYGGYTTVKPSDGGQHTHGDNNAAAPGLPAVIETLRVPKSDLSPNFKEHRLGDGAFGVVYRGELLRGHVQIAIKSLDVAHVSKSFSGLTAQQLRDAFVWEALNLALTHHPGTVPLLGVCDEDGELFMLLPFCDGGDLQHAIAKSGRASWALLWRRAAQLAAALRYLHANGQVGVLARAHALAVSCEDDAQRARPQGSTSRRCGQFGSTATVWEHCDSSAIGGQFGSTATVRR